MLEYTIGVIRSSESIRDSQCNIQKNKIQKGQATHDKTAQRMQKIVQGLPHGVLSGAWNE